MLGVNGVPNTIKTLRLWPYIVRGLQVFFRFFNCNVFDCNLRINT
jgi:hypothetical protein